MLTTEQIERYNPINAKTLTTDELGRLHILTNDELKQLALAYPPSTNSAAYLILHDANKKQQIGQRSTYPALWSLRAKNAQKQYTILTFAVLYGQTTSAPNGLSKAPVSDLTETELKEAPGLTNGPAGELIEGPGKETAGPGGQTTSAPTPAPKKKTVPEMVALIQAATSITEIDDIVGGDTRKGVTDAATAAKAAL